MRKRSLLVLLALCAAGPAGAQVTVDLHALEALPATNPAPRPAARPPVRPKVTLAAPMGAPTAVPAVTPPGAPRPVEPTPAPTPMPAMAADLPIAAPPAATPETTQRAPETPKAATANLRIPFAAGETAVSKDGITALQGLLHTAYATGAPVFTVVAYAAGLKDDPSAARRISLARALSTRDALMTEGVPSRRINVRALGSQAGDGPPDRVDVGTTPSTTP